MKSAAISRFLVAAAVLALMSTPLFAQISFPNFGSTSGLTLNGSAVQNGNALELTTDGTNHVTGTAWFSPRQPVTGSFSTTFSFRITHASQPADGIAFVIQNTIDDSGLSAVGGSGGAIGYGNPDPGDIGAPISNSLAIEFDTYQNGWDPDANHVAVQSCGTGPNSQVHSTPGTNCTIGLASLPPTQTTLADGAVHTATITYAAPSGAGPGILDVILDNHDLFPGGLSFDWSTLTLNSGTAFVGFTGSTGGSTETNDILSWTFTPQAQSASLPAVNVPAVLPFNGGTGNLAYDYNAVLTGGGVTSWTAQVQPILISQSACNKLVQKKFPLAQCFVYQNAAPGVDSSVLFSLTCPGSGEHGTCGDDNQDFFADLGSEFTFSKAENPGFQLLAATIGPYPGWLKGSGPDALNPCLFGTNPSTTFVSNQISSFSFVGDPLGTTKGKSSGGGSCWVATYFTPGEVPPGVKITSPAFTTYHLNQAVPASYTCSDPKTSQLTTNPTGPYLTAKTCTQSQAPNNNNGSSCSSNVGGTITCSGGVDTSVKGLHVFTVTSKDTGGNVGANAVIYNVVKP